MTWIYPCHDSRCAHKMAEHKGLSLVDGRVVDEGDYPPPKNFGPNRCLVPGCPCTDYHIVPWSQFPSQQAWEEAVRTGGNPP